VQQYKGVKWIYIRRDIQSAFYYWRRGELTLQEWRQSWRGRKGYAMFSWRDPAQFWADLFHAAGILAGKRKKEQQLPATPIAGTVLPSTVDPK
jgi:predicted ATP-grasp superfamily ATP-dependent carboligase